MELQLDPTGGEDGNDARMYEKMPPSYEGFGVTLKSSASSSFVGLGFWPQ